jgi:hypothetical protein
VRSCVSRTRWAGKSGRGRTSRWRTARGRDRLCRSPRPRRRSFATSAGTDRLRRRPLARELVRRTCDRDLVLDHGSSAIVLAGRNVRDLPTVGDDLALEGWGVEGDDLGCPVRVVHERLVSAVDHGHEDVLHQEAMRRLGGSGSPRGAGLILPSCIQRDRRDRRLAQRALPEHGPTPEFPNALAKRWPRVRTGQPTRCRDPAWFLKRAMGFEPTTLSLGAVPIAATLDDGRLLTPATMRIWWSQGGGFRMVRGAAPDRLGHERERERINHLRRFRGSVVRGPGVSSPAPLPSHRAPRPCRISVSARRSFRCCAGHSRARVG